MARRSKAADFDPVDVGNDEHGDEPVAVMRGPLHAAFVPASITRLDAEQVELLGAVQHLALEIADRQDRVAQLIGECREWGISWAAIGWSIGTSGEAARKRFGLDDE